MKRKKMYLLIKCNKEIINMFSVPFYGQVLAARC